MKIIDKPKKYISIDLIPFSKKLEVIFVEVTNQLSTRNNPTADLSIFLARLTPPKGIYIMEQIGKMQFKIEFDNSEIEQPKIIEYIKTLDI